ncbi:MAG: hypothetical protein V7668_03935 [Cereibacter changlensis]|uniref:Uncharacterized protein n=2 Tax=Cereibacter changlensis TaxID=402884 RepID=A0A2T4JUX3_9RHOB|nr:hypothetical protein [Cereibacter changlensis]PTE21712.1 hypothetical protein C5F48_10920 [Cereibacter changlensis JA139]PZX57219.1 hypothetical protein LX76_00759 [Cereibacter changlensis]
MQEMAELERRITAALERIGAGLEGLTSVAALAEPAENPLQAELDDEKMANAQLTERLRAVKERDAATIARLEAQVEKMTRQLDAQGLELQRMRKTTIQLREHLRSLRTAQSENVAEPHLVNKTMLAELEALRATRLSEMAEMDEILSELTPLIEEARADA